MATVYWVGNQRARAWSNTCTVTAAATSGTITATVNGKADVYTVTASDTSTALAAASAMAQWQTSPVAELANFTFTLSGSVITATGPADGRPVAVTFAASGGSTTVTSGTPVTATSPSDANDAANWTGGIPTNGDTAVFENTSVSCLYNLSALTAVTFLPVKRASMGGEIGLPDTNPLGYPEYLATHLETAGVTLLVEDNGVMCRLRGTSASATTLTVTGDGGGTLYSESVEFYGPSHTSSVVNVNGGTLAWAPLTSQSAAAGTVRVANGVLRAGPSAVPVAATVYDSQCEFAGNYTTMVVDGNSQVKVTRAATAATSTTLDGGVMTWASTGGPNTTTVGTGATLDFSGAPAAVTVGTITLEAGSTLLDPYERMAKTYNLTLNCKASEVTMDLGTRFNLAVS